MNKKVAIITGAGSGLGASLALKLAELNYYVCLIGRSLPKLQETANKLPKEHYKIYSLDVSNKEKVSHVFDSIKNELGTVDLLINNAGLGVFDLTENINEEAIHKMIDINLKGTIFCTQEALPIMKENNNGTIANIISTAGLEGKETESVYCASKFGVRGFTESLIEELKETNMRIFGAYMGGMKTEFWDGIFDEQTVNRLMDPDDIADIIIHNISVRQGLNVSEVVIKNHF